MILSWSHTPGDRFSCDVVNFDFFFNEAGSGEFGRQKDAEYEVSFVSLILCSKIES